MPHITLNKTKLYFEDTAPANQEKPVIFFAHGLLWSCRMWDKHIKVLQKDFRCISMDFRGQGQSAIAKSGYDMDSLTNDVTALLDYLKVDKFHFVGLSMGGFVGQRMALKHPKRLQKLVLLNTSADSEPEENLAGYKLLVKIATVLGARSVMDELVKVMHGKTFLKQAKKDPAKKAQLKQFKNMMAANKRRSLKKTVYGVITRKSVYERIKDIQQPTLIMVGDEDVATTVAKSQRIHMQIANSKLYILEKAGHMSAMEQPEKTTQLMRDFLTK